MDALNYEREWYYLYFRIKLSSFEWEIKNNYASVGDSIGPDVSLSTNIINKISPVVGGSSNDFRSSIGSYLIDNDEEITWIIDGFYRLKPEVGAYEYGLIPWIPGANSNN